MRHRRIHNVGTRIERFRHHVAGIVNNVGIVARTTTNRIGPHAAIQCIGATVADDCVGKRITRTVNIRCSGQCQVFGVGGQCVGDAGLDQISAFVQRFSHQITNVVDDVGVVALATGHSVGIQAAVERVVASIAD